MALSPCAVVVVTGAAFAAWKAATATGGSGTSGGGGADSDESLQSAIAASLGICPPGGDGAATILRVSPGGFRDVAQNNNTELFNLTLAEAPDDVAPVLIGADYNFGTGLLTLRASETLDARDAAMWKAK